MSRISRTEPGVKRDLRSLVRVDVIAMNPHIMGAESVSFVRKLRDRFPDVPVLILEYLERNPEYQSFDSKEAGLRYLPTPFDDRSLDKSLDELRVPSHQDVERN